MTVEFERFRDQLRVLDEKLAGTAALEHTEEQVGLTVRMNAGKGTLEGFLADSTAGRLSFENIVAQLRAGPAAVPGLALLELMLTNSYESALYAGDRDALRDQLSRVHQLMGRSSEPSRWGERNHQRPRTHELACVLGIVADRARRTDGQS